VLCLFQTSFTPFLRSLLAIAIILTIKNFITYRDLCLCHGFIILFVVRGVALVLIHLVVFILILVPILIVIIVVILILYLILVNILILVLFLDMISSLFPITFIFV
jgi:hypothetical protein